MSAFDPNATPLDATSLDATSLDATSLDSTPLEPATPEPPAPAEAPDLVYYQQSAMLMLVFRFKGSRKLVATRLMTSTDFAAELEAHLPVLDNLYGAHEVSSVEVVSYQRGGFYYDPWPAGLARVKAHQAARFAAEGREADDLEETEETEIAEQAVTVDAA